MIEETNCFQIEPPMIGETQIVQKKVLQKKVLQKKAGKKESSVEESSDEVSGESDIPLNILLGGEEKTSNRKTEENIAREVKRKREEAGRPRNSQPAFYRMVWKGRKTVGEKKVESSSGLLQSEHVLEKVLQTKMNDMIVNPLMRRILMIGGLKWRIMQEWYMNK